ncbi:MULTISPECIES: hypothetical protein [unclassified Mucilaginibacter]|uniref:hypothetical protein n=1 Tax=unclassified Mucilaginibacter TaxID=2617802 RepID=UPI0008C32667|nr:MULTISPECIES: hypothetical protein [unclassified Mucilaginibacter]WDF78791.1 hypothetical protein PQ469_02065 [Mucilaginibacter sp. KACC 22773]SEO38109.1 hypothetical protein SAMN05428947_102167 [Mucilaginibacter sp. OK283]
MKKNVFFYLVLCTFMASCNFATPKKEVRQRRVSLFCLKENDTVYVKITNNTDSTIYIPGKYMPDFTNNDDTLHFETINKFKYGVTRYYRYKHVLAFEFYTTREINGIKADSVEEYKSQVTFFNQFRVLPMRDIKPGSSFIERLEFDVPRYVTVGQAVYYKSPFFQKNQINSQYLYKDFLLFDSLRANYVNAPVLNRYR